MEQFLERVLERLMEHLLEQLSEQILVEQIVAAPQWVLEQVIKQVVEFREAKERLDPCAQAKKSLAFDSCICSASRGCILLCSTILCYMITKGAMT